MERDEALELIRSNHEFPGPFQFRVVVRPAFAAQTVSAMVAAAGPDARAIDVDERHSSKGTYVALHVRLQLDDAERVLDVYEVLDGLEHVLAKM